MEINFFNEDINIPDLNFKALKKWIHQVITGYSKETGDLNYIFCSDEYLLLMNKEYLQHDYYTDIITFNYCVENIISGDIFISLDRVNENADKFDSQSTEIYRVIIHGVLHLIGFDDHTDEDRIQMRNAEDNALSKIDF